MPGTESPATSLVTIVTATTCETARRASILRSIHSVLNQQGVGVQLLIVVNGTRYDAPLFDQLRSDARFKTLYVEEPSLPGALAHGRAAVKTPFFGFLDDDDELLPGALKLRCATLLQDQGVDFVVTNGYARGKNEPYIPHGEQIVADPLGSLLGGNWVSSCGGLYRSSSCDQHYFSQMSRYLEWTVLAMQLLLDGKRVVFLDECTFRVNDSPTSLSKSDDYRMAIAEALARLMKLPMPPHIRVKLRRLLLAARHDQSVTCAKNGQRIQAWKHHLQSMMGWSGLKYFSYTRRLLF